MIIAKTIMQEMPERCCDCHLLRASMMLCTPKQIWFGKEDLRGIMTMRPNWCPLVEVEERTVKVVDDEE